MKNTTSFKWLAFLLLVAPLFAERVPGRYIVELTTVPVVDHLVRSNAARNVKSSAAISHRARIHSEQQDAQNQLEQRGATVLERVDTVANALFVQAPDSAAAQLSSVPGVKRVLPVRAFYPVLDRAVLLHKVADAWNQIGMDRAGAGMKIGIMDTGIDSSHAGFRDSSLVVPASFPRANSTSDLAYTNAKVIVARSYVNLLPNRDPDHSARDHVGHGTALAMLAAGVRNAGPLATITGVAPKAYLGSYKIFGTPGYNDFASDDAILKALDDAVTDGMDVINMSFGDDLAPRLSDDLDAQAIERASQAGVIVVVAAGNNGPDPNTISSPATAPSAIAAGASSNDRTFAASAEVTGLSPMVAITGNGGTPDSPVTSNIVDIAGLDGNGLACDALPSNSIANAIALILRGSCTFETKLLNAQRAGAIAALVYATADSPDPIAMDVGTASIPAQMVGNSDGVAIKQDLASQSSVAGTLRFTLNSVARVPNRLTGFSAAGPSVDTGIKPDLTAVGKDVYVATQTFDPSGDMYDPSGYILVDGTSFSTPLIAGTAALIKAARPGLTVAQYRSLLIDGGGTAQTHTGDTPVIQQSGGGLLDANAALNASATAVPALLSFGAGGSDPQLSRTVTITNVSSTADTFAIAVAARADGAVPLLGVSTVSLDPGSSVDVPVSLNGQGLASGTYDGYLTVTASSSGAQIRIPYWYAVASAAPARVTILSTITSARRASLQSDAILLRITDASGVVIPGAQIQVTTLSGGGLVRAVNSRDSDVPGMIGIDLQLGSVAGTNVFHIQAGNVYSDVSITGR